MSIETNKPTTTADLHWSERELSDDNKPDSGGGGVVKWFEEAKGYGFITDRENRDYYFGISDIVGADLPSRGDTVNFTPTSNKKGLSQFALNLPKSAPMYSV